MGATKIMTRVRDGSGGCRARRAQQWSLLSECVFLSYR
jgi:hypothetical protein